MDKIKSDLESVDEDKLKMVNIVDFLYKNEAWKTLTKKLLNFITTENNDVDILLKDINQLNEFLANEEFQTKYNEDYNNLTNSGKLEDELSLETLLALSDEDKKEMITLFLERITFTGENAFEFRQRKKLIKWIDKSEDIKIDLWENKTPELREKYGKYIQAFIDQFKWDDNIAFYKIFSMTTLPGLFEDLILEEYGKALCGETDEWKDITYLEIENAEANLSVIEKWQLMLAITRGATTLIGTYYGQQYLTGTWVAEWQSDLTSKNDNIKTYNQKLQKRLKKLKWTENYFELENLFRVKKENDRVTEKLAKSIEENDRATEENDRATEENKFVNFMTDILINGETTTNELLEKRYDFMVNKYDKSYTNYHLSKKMREDFEIYYNKHKNR